MDELSFMDALLITYGVIVIWMAFLYRGKYKRRDVCIQSMKKQIESHSNTIYKLEKQLNRHV